MQSLVLYFVFVALRVILNYSSLRNYLRLPSVIPVDSEPVEWPSVSIVVSALGDDSNLTAMLRSMAALTYPAVREILICRPAGVSTEVAGLDIKSTTISIDQPPEGWTLENYAYWRAAELATGDWILFTGSNTVHQPASLGRLMAIALKDGLQAISMFLQQRCVTPAERMILPFAYQQYFTAVPFKRVNLVQDPAALASGDYFLIEKKTYLSAGGHRTVSGETLGNMALAAQLKRLGVPFRVMRGEYQASVRSYKGWSDIWQRFCPPAKLGWSAWLMWLNTALAGLAIPCAIYGLLAHSRAFELAALVTYLTAGMELITWEVIFQAPILGAMLQPLAFLLFVPLALTHGSQGSRGQRTAQIRGRP